MADNTKNSDKKPSRSESVIEKQKKRDNLNISYAQNREAILQGRIILCLAVAFVIFVIFIIFRNLTMEKQTFDTSVLKNYTENTEVSDEPKPLGEDEIATGPATEFNPKAEAVILWGDSFTAEKNNPFITAFSDTLKEKGKETLKVYAAGSDTEIPETVGCKTGIYPLYTDSFTIPADTHAVDVVIRNSKDGGQFLPDKKFNFGLNPCTVNGVKGSIGFDGVTTTFTREKSGNVVEVKSKTPITTGQMDKKEVCLSIYFFGGGYGETPDELTKIYKELVQGNENYIIVGAVNGMRNDIAAYENKFEDTFGSHFINMREYLCSQVFDDYDLTIDSQDIDLLKQDSVPESFKQDDEMFTEEAGKAAAQYICGRLEELGLI